MKRKGLSKKLRFSVFSRDNYTCAYCGSVPPNVKLVVDHIVPVSKGGGDEIDNLRTSCNDCNSGKGATKLEDSKEPASSVLARAQENLEAIETAQLAAKAGRARKKLRTTFLNYVCDITDTNELRKSTITGMVNICYEFGVEAAYEFIDISVRKTCVPYFNEKDFISYLHGIAKHRRNQGEAVN